MTHSLSFPGHPDDELLFMNPDVMSDALAGHRTWICYLTAGNLTPGPAGMDYADKRIHGVRAAWAKAAGLANDWSFQLLNIGGREVATNYLAGNPNIRLAFTFIHAAAGSDQVGDLSRMWADPAFVAHPIDGRPSYTKASFVAMLRGLADLAAPDLVRGMDPNGQPCGDNIDHDRAGKFALLSNLNPVTSRVIRRHDTYFGYCCSGWSQNVGEPWPSRKLAAWKMYKQHDPAFSPGSTSWDEMATRQHPRQIRVPGDSWIDF